MEDKRYWIWLSLVFPYGSDKPARLLSLYDSPDAVYALDEAQLAGHPFLSAKDIQALKRTQIERADRILSDCEQKGISVVTYGEAAYPKRLRLIYGPPMVLYYAGSLSDLDEPVTIAVVGTRKATEYTYQATYRLSRDMASAGVVIVSGCALGCDTAAHMGALDAGGRTISVLACGLDVDYPAGSREMKRRILERGALLTELPPGALPRASVFHTRNRILAGLSNGVLVTHAPRRSGSLITAEHALEQGKEVFCVPPYDIFDPTCMGVARYLRDGAIGVFSAQDVLAEYMGDYGGMLDLSRMEEQPELPPKPAAEPGPSPSDPVDAEEKRLAREAHRQECLALISSFDEIQLGVYNALDLQPRSAEELAGETHLEMAALLATLTELEILGLVEALSGSRYQLIRK